MLGDCHATIVRMRETDVVAHGKANFKFMAKGASPIPGLPLIQTPWTYVFW